MNIYVQDKDLFKPYYIDSIDHNKSYDSIVVNLKNNVFYVSKNKENNTSICYPINKLRLDFWPNEVKFDDKNGNEYDNELKQMVIDKNTDENINAIITLDINSIIENNISPHFLHCLSIFNTTVNKLQMFVNKLDNKFDIFKPQYAYYKNNQSLRGYITKYVDNNIMWIDNNLDKLFNNKELYIIVFQIIQACISLYNFQIKTKNRLGIIVVSGLTKISYRDRISLGVRYKYNDNVYDFEQVKVCVRLSRFTYDYTKSKNCLQTNCMNILRPIVEKNIFSVDLNRELNKLYDKNVEYKYEDFIELLNDVYREYSNLHGAFFKKEKFSPDLVYDFSNDKKEAEKGKIQQQIEDSTCKYTYELDNYRPEMSNRKFVEGLQSLTVYKSNEYNKIIYVLGEQHESKNLGLCKIKNINIISVKKLINNIIRYNPSTIFDLFLEYAYVPNKQQEKGIEIEYYDQSSKNDSYLFDYVADYVSKCIIDQCNSYKNTRVHLTDIRRINDYIIRVYLLYLYPEIHSDSKFFKNIDIKHKEFENIDFIQEKLVSVFEIGKVDKQIVNIPKKYGKVITQLNNLKTDILNKDKLEAAKPSFVKKFIDSYKDKKELDKDDRLKIDQYYDSITRLMDIYVLARLFRNFNPYARLDDKNPRIVRYGEPTNIIIYEGELHCVFHRKIFETLGFERVYIAKKLDNSCIEITGLDELKLSWIK